MLHLIGPVGIYHLEGDKNILLIADDHINNVKCSISSSNSVAEHVSLLDFLDHNITSSPEVVDFFIETDYVKNGECKGYNIEGDLFLKHVIQHYLEYLNADKTKCPDKHLRMHYCDVRSLLPHVTEYELRTSLMVLDILAADGNIFSLYEESSKWITRLSNSIIIPEDWTQIESNLKIKNQLEKITNIELKAKLQDLFQTKRTLTQDKLVNYFTRLTELTKGRLLHPFIALSSSIMDFICSTLNQLNDEYYTSYASFMDVYLLARLFSPHTSKNVIIYAGYDHINTYVNLLSQLNYKVKFQNTSHQENIDFQCVDISNLQQPIFHAK